MLGGVNDANRPGGWFGGNGEGRALYGIVTANAANEVAFKEAGNKHIPVHDSAHGGLESDGAEFFDTLAGGKSARRRKSITISQGR